jgi:hypothetical protein
MGRELTALCVDVSARRRAGGKKCSPPFRFAEPRCSAQNLLTHALAATGAHWEKT